MKRNVLWLLPVIMLGLSGFLWLTIGAQAQESNTSDQEVARTTTAENDLPTNFTYQGLIDGPNGAVNDTCSFSVSLKEGTTTLDTLVINNVSVQDGYFALDLAYSAAFFDGRDLSLDTTVNCAQLADTLQFSSSIAVVPYARHAQTADSATTATNATNATNAVSAQTATSATSAQTAVTATTATNATNAVSAQTATTAQTAVSATTATTATNAVNAQTAITAQTAVSATTATTATTLVTGAEISGSYAFGMLEITNSNAGGDGLSIISAGDDAVHIANARYGINIDQASQTGILITNSDNDGIDIRTTDGNGVEVSSATKNGVQANSISANQYGGYFTNSAPSGNGYGLFAQSNSITSPDLVLGADGDGVTNGLGLITSDPRYTYTDLRFESQDEIEFQISTAAGGTSAFSVFDESNNLIFQLDESGNLSLAGTLMESVSLRSLADTVPSITDEFVGSTTLDNGRASISLPTQLTGQGAITSYQVFLTAVGSYCPLYIAEKQTDLFVITADNGAACTASVDYQIVAEISLPQLDLSAALEAEQAAETHEIEQPKEIIDEKAGE